MMAYGRSCIAAFLACTLSIIIAAPAFPSYTSEAGHEYRIASQRFADLKKSKKKKYRSYWIDCVRTFERVEKKYPKSTSAAEACFDRSAVYEELYRYSRKSKDLNSALSSYTECQSSYPKNDRAPEALYRVVETSLKYRKDRAAAADVLGKLESVYPESSWTRKAQALLNPGVRTARPVHKQEKAEKTNGEPAHTTEKTARSSAVKSIRYFSGDGYTRIVIDQDQEARYDVLELKNPDRLVFDLQNSHLDQSVDKDPLPVNDGMLKQVRASQYKPDAVRIVLDLASIKSYVAFPLHGPERLVIDVTGEGGGAGSGANGIASDASPSSKDDLKANAEPKSSPQTTLPPPVTAAGGSEGDKLPLSGQLGLKIKTIAIDAGHGGHDPGAIGKRGTKEKNLTLDIAKRLAELVKERLGCNVVMTRDKDVFIPLEDRPAIARTKKADLFVSIHINANRRRSTRGIETYIQGLRASDRDAMATAARENATTSKTLSELDDELTKILKGLRMESNDEDSIHLAHAVQTSLVDSMKPVQGHVANLGVKSAFFYVLINTGMPSILAEVGFISNPTEEALLNKASYRQKIAEALFEGVKKYMDSRSPLMMGI